MSFGLPVAGRVREAARLRRRERGLRRGLPDDVARAWAASVRDLPVPGTSTAGDARRLLVLPKTGGTEDVVAAFAHRGAIDLHVAALPRGEVKAVFRALVGEGHALLTDLDYRPDDPDLADAKARYRAFLVPVLQRLRDDLGLAGLVGANVAYYAERELAAACEAIDLPFLVLHKESLRSPRQREHFTRAYRDRIGPFTGRAVAVYNRDERDSQVAGGLVEDAMVVGAPRIDALHEVRCVRGPVPGASDGPVVLFAIDPGAGTWTPLDAVVDTGAPRWEHLARGTEDAFLRLARRHPDRRFVIKAKVGHGERLLARLPSGLPDNVHVVTDGTATGLLRRAAAMVGFNTTVVAEGLAAGVPVIVPGFAEASEADAAGWMHPVGPAVRTVRDADAFEDVVLDALGTGPSAGDEGLGSAAVAVLDTLVGNSDGRAGERTWRWLRDRLRLP